MKKKIITGVIAGIIIAVVAIMCILKNSELKIMQTGAISQESTNYNNHQNFNDVADATIDEINGNNGQQTAERNVVDLEEKQEKNMVMEDKKTENNNVTKKGNTENAPRTENTSPTGNTTYYIKVNYQANAVTIYKKDENGYYTIPVKAMICSCGTATPKSGVYKTSKGYEWGTLEGGTYGRYSTRIVGGILFHSVPYIKESEDSLEYWEYDKLGTTASLGCVRLAVEDCKWIFDNVEVGTQVEFYADLNPGPLGKPSAQKISDNEVCRNWDPTDTSPNSPWNMQ